MRCISYCICALLTLQGCATLTSGTTQEVSFQSNPEDVTVTIIHREPGEATDGPWHEEKRVLGKTPLTLHLDKEEQQSVVFSKEGYKPVKMKLVTELDSWFWGNIVFGGVFGSTTDTMSGAAYQYTPSQFFVTLIPEKATPIDASMNSGQRDRAREFIVRRYTGLISDLHQGKGEDLRAIMQLLNIPASQEPDARQKLQALSIVYSDAAVFADHVADLYLGR